MLLLVVVSADVGIVVVATVVSDVVQTGNRTQPADRTIVAGAAVCAACFVVVCHEGSGFNGHRSVSLSRSRPFLKLPTKRPHTVTRVGTPPEECVRFQFDRLGGGPEGLSHRTLLPSTGA